jgi:lycopene cyclase domain-containing protein
MRNYSYLIWLTVFLVLPVIAIWIKFYKTLAKYIVAILIIIALEQIGLIWDFWGVREGIWRFPLGRNLGYYFAGLPLEEYLAFMFFACFVSSLTIILRFHGPLKIRSNHK